MLHGHCQCGRIRFEVDSDIEDFSHCHCSQCRRIHGAAFATFAGVPRNSFHWQSATDSLACYSATPANQRYFCVHCGSSILVETNDETELLYLSMSTLEGDPRHPPGYHEYVGSKAPWHEINDRLPRYDAEITN